MELTKCKECGKEISDKTSTCAHCGTSNFQREVNDLSKQSQKQKFAFKFPIEIIYVTIAALFAIYSYDSIRNTTYSNQGINLQKAPEEISQSLLTSQFSRWDASHPALIQQVKSFMHNPDSFEHVETIYYWTDEAKQSAEDKITVKMTYRGTNGFGGVVTETVIAQVDTHGNVLEVLGE